MTDIDTCPACRHRKHPPNGCLNMASDNDCACRHGDAGREAAVRVVLDHRVSTATGLCGCGRWVGTQPEAIARHAVDALIAAGWGDLLDEQLLTAAEKGRAEQAEAAIARALSLAIEGDRDGVIAELDAAVRGGR